METAVMTNAMLVQESIKDFKEGNIPALLNNLAENVKWFTPGPKEILPWAGYLDGKEAVAKFFLLLDKEVRFTKFEPKEFIEKGDKVVVLGSRDGISKRTGKTTHSDWAMVFTVKSGKVTHFHEYSDTYNTVQAYR
jgi:uncharacterized protein